MKNILSAEIYRLKKQKSSWILLLILLGYSFMSAIYAGIAFGNTPYLLSVYDQMKEMYASYGLSSMWEQIEEIRNQMNFTSGGQFIAVCAAGHTTLFMSAFVLLYLAKPRYTGFVRNYYTDVRPASIVCAQALILFIYSGLLTFIPALAAIPALHMFFTGFSEGIDLNLIIYLLLTWLLTTAGGMLEMMLISLSKRPIFGTIFAALYACIFSGFLYEIVDFLAQGLGGGEFTIEPYTVFGNLSGMTYGSTAAYITAFASGVLYLALALTADLFLLGKKDQN